jgi:superfamily II DNA or RNA helicase
MSLLETAFPSVIDTSSTNIVTDFFIPALAESIRYDRGVGYFSSSWLKLTAKGMVKFATNGGRARWITSPILSPGDWAALELGDQARGDPILLAALERNIKDLQASLEEETLSALAWMVADGILTFKLALPVNKLVGGDFHDKFGRFVDNDGNQVCFMGSHNESMQGTINSESFAVYSSWGSEALQPYSKSIVDRFERLWADLDPNVRVYDLPTASLEEIIQLRSTDRHYPIPDWSRIKHIGENPVSYLVTKPSLPLDITLRDYQIAAIDAWFDAGCRGLLEMATGTGKTITALSASAELFNRQGSLAVIIACPYQHLVDQWDSEAHAFGYLPIKAYSSRNTWLDKLNERISSFNHGDTTVLCVITTHSTFCTEHFQDSIARISGHTLLVADEAHHLGSENRRRFYPEQISSRLALSATPDRWYDDVGTDALRAYFGSTVFEFSLADAIGFSLTPYYYNPILVELTDEEMLEYRALSTKIGQLLAQDRDPDNDQLSLLLIKRANLLNKAKNKLTAVSELVDQASPIIHSLFYCAPGQIDEVVKLLGWDKHLQVHRFTAREDIPTRQRLLDQFDKGQLQALVAMHCLDEGVDVPSTRTAFILASSGNPRQFIQRRGRVLRRHPGKHFATVYDLITVPPHPENFDPQSLAAERSILRKELKRFVEFADSALNTQHAYEVIWDIVDEFGILDFE